MLLEICYSKFFTSPRKLKLSHLNKFYYSLFNWFRTRKIKATWTNSNFAITSNATNHWYITLQGIKTAPSALNQYTYFVILFYLFAIYHAWGHNILQCQTKMPFAIYHAWMLVDIKRFRPLLAAFSSNFSTLQEQVFPV